MSRIIVEGPRSFHVAQPAELLADAERELAAERPWARAHVQERPDFGWVLGRFVEADNANENGHIFGLEDLRRVHPSIISTPLNMLHRAHHVVGAFVATEMVGDAASALPVAAAYGGDLVTPSTVNPHVEALAAFWRWVFPDEYRAVRAAFDAGAAYYCVDDETELMTAEGWKRRSELVVGEEILTLNTESGLSEWLPLEHVFEYQLDGEPVVEMEGMMHSSVTTPNHRWWVERRSHQNRSQSQWQWRTTESLTQETWIPRAMPHGDFPVTPKYEDAFVELAAWFWTEGTTPRNGGVRIFQSHAVNEPNCDRIAACLTRLYGPPARVRDGGMWYSTRRDRMTTFHLSADAAAPLKAIGGKRISPSFVRQLTEAQLRLFFDVSMEADGDKATSGQVGIKQKDLECLRVLEMVAALLGIPTNTSPCKDGMWRMGVVRRSNRFNPVFNAQRGKGFTIQNRPHHGVVWCPSTANGTFLARRRGSVYWTGNSMEAVPRSLTCEACGGEFPYAGARSDAYCAHLNEFKSAKRLNDPHFVGGALIVPPTRPGWRKADVTELAGLVEANIDAAGDLYDQVAASSPQLSPAEWEAIMAELLVAAADGDVPLRARTFALESRLADLRNGAAMADGSFVIEGEEDLRRALAAFTYDRKDRAALKRHIVARARLLGMEDLLPDTWYKPRYLLALEDDFVEPADAVLAVYIDTLSRTGWDLDDPPAPAAYAEQLADGSELWQLVDGWGEWYFHRHDDEVTWVAQKHIDLGLYASAPEVAVTKTDVAEIGWGDREWLNLLSNRLAPVGADTTVESG